MSKELDELIKDASVASVSRPEKVEAYIGDLFLSKMKEMLKYDEYNILQYPLEDIVSYGYINGEDNTELAMEACYLDYLKFFAWSLSNTEVNLCYSPEVRHSNGQNLIYYAERMRRYMLACRNQNKIVGRFLSIQLDAYVAYFENKNEDFLVASVARMVESDLRNYLAKKDRNISVREWTLEKVFLEMQRYRDSRLYQIGKKYDEDYLTSQNAIAVDLVLLIIYLPLWGLQSEARLAFEEFKECCNDKEEKLVDDEIEDNSRKRGKTNE